MNVPFRPNALEWKPGAEPHWDQWQDWFDEAATSTAFRPPAEGFDDAALTIPAIAEALEYCMPSYEKLESWRRNSLKI